MPVPVCGIKKHFFLKENIAFLDAEMSLSEKVQEDMIEACKES